MKNKLFNRFLSLSILLLGFVSCSFNEHRTDISFKIPNQVCNAIFNAREATEEEPGHEAKETE